MTRRKGRGQRRSLLGSPRTGHVAVGKRGKHAPKKRRYRRRKEKESKKSLKRGRIISDPGSVFNSAERLERGGSLN